MAEVDEITKEFLVESFEYLDRVDRELVALEQNPSDRETLGSIFRAVHSIKGACGFLGYGRLESLTHTGENLLCLLREGELTLNADITSGLLELIDALRQMLTEIEAEGNEGNVDYTTLKYRLLALTGHDAGPPPPGVTSATPVSAAPVPTPPRAEEKAPPREQAITQPAELNDGKTALDAEKTEPNESTPKFVERREQQVNGSASAENNIRVDVELLDKLMNLVSELVLARNQILQCSSEIEHPLLGMTTQRLHLITTELQEGVMKTRMQPIGNVWGKLPRVVRDVATVCSKQVRLEMEGQETELDKSIIEAIKDPLIHIIRNGVDHGIETPAERLSRGKTAEGCIALRAYHRGGGVHIEINDDGGGIHPEKVKQIAVRKGLISVEHAARMNDREAVGLLFLPGFSTAEKVTNVSGRGVGMDVVKTNIEKLGGTVEIRSVVGRGTNLLIKIPMTLAIIPVLMIDSCGERFAIPQSNLSELLHFDAEEVERGIEYIHGSPVCRLRGRLLPLVDLASELRLEDAGFETSLRTRKFTDGVNVVVVQVEGREFGLIVDGINDSSEIVVKPLGKYLKGLQVFAGSTILGDGQVALILDVPGLALRAHAVAETRDVSRAATIVQQEDTHGDRQTLLLFHLNEGMRGAIPLSSVSRLEQISCQSIERNGPQWVVQYRGQIMPLIHATGVLDGGNGLNLEAVIAGKKRISVVVYTHEKQRVGVVVEKILDIVHQTLEVCGAPSRMGVKFSAVVKGEVAEVLDMQRIVRAVEPQFFADLQTA